MSALFDNKNLFVALTYRCNAFCKKCMTRYHVNRDIEMPPEIIDKIADLLRLRRYEGVISVGSGEPLLYPHFPHFFQSMLAVNDKISLRILSNGKLLEGGLPAEYFNPRCKWGVTMDAFTQASLQGFQNGVDIERVKRNITEIVHRYGRDCLYLNYTLHSRNHREFVDFCRFAVDLGVREVYATGLKIYEGYGERLRAYRLTDTPELRDSLAHAAKILEEAGVSSGGIQIGKDRWKPGCFLGNRASPIIDVDGTLAFCSGREDAVIGSICDPDIESVWADMSERLARHPEYWCRFCHGKALRGGDYSLPKTIDRDCLRRRTEAEKES